MRKLLAALALLATVGCNDPTVHENAIDYFVCSYLPWWAGDCQSQEVRDKVESILTYGLVEAEVTCDLPALPNPAAVEGCTAPYGHACGVGPVTSSGSGYLKIRSQQLVDGSHFTSCALEGDYNYRPTIQPIPQLITRGEPNQIRVKHIFQGTLPLPTSGSLVCELVDGTIKVWHDGTFRVQLGNVPESPNPVVFANPVWYQTDIASHCTGRNLAAFGVEE